MKIIATIEARMTSSRLPGKVLKPILGRPTLELLIDRLRLARSLNDVVVATTTNPADDAIEALARTLGAGCYRGSENDVLDRVLKTAKSVNAGVIVEITGDCPLIDPGVVDQLVACYLASKFDYVANTLYRTFPRGLDTQVFSTSTLEEVSRLTQDPADREHVSLYIYRHPERFSLHNVKSGLPEKHWQHRLTVDTPEDFALIETIFERLYPQNPAFTLHDVINLLEREPELTEINREVRQKALH
jgi:spore coat polysaccharide biosynthesis protein SpsF